LHLRISVSDSITEVLAELRDALESNGFTAAEAERICLPDNADDFLHTASILLHVSAPPLARRQLTF
jgi:hypothetical protein